MSNIKVLVAGSDFHAVLLASQINSVHEGIVAAVERPPSPGNNLWKIIPQLAHADIYHGIYWEDCYKNFFAAKLMGKKTVCHWIGTDVYDVLRDKRRRFAMKILDKFIDIHLAGSPGLVEELKTINIKARWSPFIPADFNTQVYPLPASPAVLVYVRLLRHDFYRLSVIYQLAKHFQNVKFMIVGDKLEDPNCPGNVISLGFQENMEEIYKNTTALVRIVEHDGLSLMILEALARGRQVIWSEPFQYCYYAKDFEAARVALSSIISNPEINYSGANYVKETFNKNKFIGGLAEIYKKLIGKEKKQE